MAPEPGSYEVNCDVCGGEMQLIHSEWIGAPTASGPCDDLLDYYICPRGCGHCGCCGKGILLEQTCDCDCPGCAICQPEAVLPRGAFMPDFAPNEDSGEYAYLSASMADDFP